jgi:hypothetical protein
LVLLTALAWLAVTALLLRSQVAALKRELPQLRQQIAAGQLDEAKATAAQLAGHARRAHGLTTGPAWWTASEIPWLGNSVSSVRVITAQSDLLGRDVLPGVLQLGTRLTSSSLRKGDTIDLTPLVAAAPVLHTAYTAASRATARVDALPRHTALSSVDSARSTFALDLSQISDQLLAADRAAQILPPMLGQAGVKRYFIAFLNNAESRPVGGIPGAFGIMTADHGTLSFTHFESDTALDHVTAKVDLGPDYDALYGQADPTGVYVNADVSPNFPDAARIWASMWQQASGEPVDGAIALDPEALSYLLAVTGNATTPAGQVVSAGNVVALTEQLAYSRYPDTNARKEFLLSVAKSASDKLLAGGDTTALARAGGRAAQQRRLLIWSSDPAVESVLDQAGYAGTVKDTGAPFTGFTTTNAAGGKLDYYLDRRMSYVRTGCGSTSTAVATFTLTNAAPTSGLPAYVTIRADDPPAGYRPGDNRLLVSYFASAGATIESVTLDGTSVPFTSGKENGLTVAVVDVELPVTSSRTLVVTLREPASTKPVYVLRQPLARPLTVQVSEPSC